MKNLSIKSRLESKMAEIKSSNTQNKLQNRIQAAQDLRRAYGKPIEGKGVSILENIGKLLQISGSEGYAKCITPGDAAKVFLSDFNYWIETNQQPIKSIPDGMLIYVDGAFYKVSQSNMLTAIPKMAVNAGCPVQLTSGEFRTQVLEGMLSTIQKRDPSYDEIEKAILGR